MRQAHRDSQSIGKVLSGDVVYAYNGGGKCEMTTSGFATPVIGILAGLVAPVLADAAIAVH